MRLARAAIPASSEEPGSIKPTDASTGPRIATTSQVGGNLSGSYSGITFTTFVTPTGPLTLTDCVMAAGMNISTGPVVLDHCEVDGWFQVSTTNTNAGLQIFKATFTKFIGADDNDVMHLGDESWGANNSHYTNSLFEDCYIYSPYNDTDPESHFDTVQFSGGGGYATFNRVAFSYKDQAFGNGATNVINNGTENTNVTLTTCWIEGGPFGYVLAGPMTVSDTMIARSTAHWGYIYDGRTVLINCVDDTGAAI